MQNQVVVVCERKRADFRQFTFKANLRHRISYEKRSLILCNELLNGRVYQISYRRLLGRIPHR